MRALNNKINKCQQKKTKGNVLFVWESNPDLPRSVMERQCALLTGGYTDHYTNEETNEELDECFSRKGLRCQTECFVY